MGTKRALAFQDAKMNKVIKARAEATRAANQNHKKRLKLNSRLAKKEAAMRELVDNLYDYKLVYENQLESMCQILENEVGELRKEGRAKVVFGVPKLKRKKGTGNQTAVVAGNRKRQGCFMCCHCGKLRTTDQSSNTQPKTTSVVVCTLIMGRLHCNKPSR